MRIIPLSILVVVATMGGCAAKRPVTTDPVPPVGTSQIENFEPPPRSIRGEKPAPIVLPPVVLERSLPTYPKSALGDAIACTARILYHVEVSGRAKLVRLEWDEPPPGEHLAEFEEAIGAAVLGWVHKPAVQLIPRTLDDGTIDSTRKPVPRAQRALIRFRVENGVAVVE